MLLRNTSNYCLRWTSSTYKRPCQWSISENLWCTSLEKSEENCSVVAFIVRILKKRGSHGNIKGNWCMGIEKIKSDYVTKKTKLELELELELETQLYYWIILKQQKKTDFFSLHYYNITMTILQFFLLHAKCLRIQQKNVLKEITTNQRNSYCHLLVSCRTNFIVWHFV